MKYRFINDHRHVYRMAILCRVMQVSRGGFYQWVYKPLSDKALEDQRLLALIRHSYEAINGVHGTRRVLGDLREAGGVCSKHRVANIMRAHKIKAIRGYKAPRSIVGRPSILAPNRLQCEFTVDTPDQAWVTDVTYLRTWQGWLYLAVVIDLHSHKVVGWSMKPTLGRELAIGALFMAVLRRKPVTPVIVHSDQGSQYGSDDWKRFCDAHQITAQHEPQRQLLG